MHFQKKLGIGFILFGVFIIVAVYFSTSGGAFAFSALMGLMAIFFGAFQLMLANITITKSTEPSHGKKTTKAKKARR